MAVVLTDEQANLLSNDLAELINQVTTFQEDFNIKKFKEEVKREIIVAIRSKSVVNKIKQEELELEENLLELKKVKQYFIECRKKDVLSYVALTIITGLISSLFTAYMIKVF